METLIQGSDERLYLTAEVIAVILIHIREKVKTCFEVRGKHELVNTFHWVLTITGSWNENSRRIMREAAALVNTRNGYCLENINYFQLSLG